MAGKDKIRVMNIQRSFFTEFFRLFALLWQILGPRPQSRKKLPAMPADQVVLLTGATSGIGLQIALELLKTSHRLVLTGRSQSLDCLKRHGIIDNERVLILPLDISSSTDHKFVLEKTMEIFGRLDVIIHNAGIAARSPFEQVHSDLRRKILDVNYLGPIEFTKSALPYMKRDGGKIIFHSSAIAFVSCPFKGAYAASKHALDGEVESMYYEFKDSGIQISLFESGVVASDAYDKMIMPAETRSFEFHQRERFLFLERLIRLHLRLTNFTPEKIAKKILLLMSQEELPLRTKGTYDCKVFALVKYFLPESLYLYFMHRLTTPVSPWGLKPNLTQSFYREVTMRSLLSIVVLLFLTATAYAQANNINEIKTAFNQSKDLNRSQSFENIMGKTFQCEEFVFNNRQNTYMTFATRITFAKKLKNYYGSGTTLDYLEYAEYRRTDQDIYSQVPHFGCDGIEWGVAHLDDAPYLHMSNLVGRVGNTNLGPCYNLKFRIHDKNNLVAIGVYNDKIIHALKCGPK